MPSPTNLLLALAATALTIIIPPTLSAPTTTTTTTPQQITKRATAASYHPAPPPENDYCIEGSPVTQTYGPSAPLAADCTTLYQANPGPGYWQMSSTQTGWTRLAASGTCAIEVRLSSSSTTSASTSSGDQGGGEYRFGTNDVRFFIRANAGAAQAREGRVGVSSGVWCRRQQQAAGGGGGLVGVDWRVVHS
ncbi:hypothetical protein C8A00DRAFT_14795 [Chaetomidium leptoderma]|uniref:Ecp2 effector protein-like domain-containing protein n=1 Tax=Chaetomidium leptoderma TaxID=669021 RepID=A0AAN6VPL5_9PEZI|nr:hypothetical protein C8A00DRAFT_14795 [Chaetomidium leptoderma]